MADTNSVKLGGLGSKPIVSLSPSVSSGWVDGILPTASLYLYE